MPLFKSGFLLKTDPSLGSAPPYQITPIVVGEGTTGTYSDNGGGNNFHLASWVKNLGSRPTVAVFGEAIGEGANSTVWGGNFVAYANSPTATAIAAEINWGKLVDGGAAFGIVLASAGNYATNAHIQMQSNNAASKPVSGIIFNHSGTDNPVSDTLIKTSGAVAIPHGIDLSSATFSAEAIKIKENNFIALSADGSVKMKYNSSTGDIEFYNGSTLVGHIDVSGGVDHAL